MLTCIRMSTTTREYTITEALQELRLLSSRINKAINQTKFIGAWKSEDSTAIDRVCPDATAAFQSVNDLIERRARIKAAIMQSNASTTVEIGGKMYTVAEAISTKEYINDRKELLDTLKQQKAEVMETVVSYSTERQRKIDNLIERSFGREGAQKQNPEDIKAISEMYMKKNVIAVVDPIKIDDQIKRLEEEIDLFVHSVDHRLSYINAVTKITI